MAVDAQMQRPKRPQTQGCVIVLAQSFARCETNRASTIRQPRHTFANSTAGYYFWWWGEEMVAWQSLRLGGRKVCNIKKVGISQVNAIMLRLVSCRQATSLWQGRQGWWCKARDSAVLEGLVRGEGWWSGIPSGSCPNFCGRQHLTFDKKRARMPYKMNAQRI